jgi:hypothetical protein
MHSKSWTISNCLALPPEEASPEFGASLLTKHAHFLSVRTCAFSVRNMCILRLIVIPESPWKDSAASPLRPFHVCDLVVTTLENLDTMGHGSPSSTSCTRGTASCHPPLKCGTRTSRQIPFRFHPRPSRHCFPGWRTWGSGLADLGFRAGRPGISGWRTWGSGLADLGFRAGRPGIPGWRTWGSGLAYLGFRAGRPGVPGVEQAP